MFRGFKRYAFAGITAGMIALFAATSPANGMTEPSGASVCDRGSRGDGAYDAQCLRTGTIGDAAEFWYSTPVGAPGHLRDDFTTRRSICAYANRHGGVRQQARELVFDVTYDNYRNNRQVNSWVADIAQGDCLRFGYSDAVSGLAVVDLHRLPSRDCWYEVSYPAHRVDVESVCKD